jgi:hypothetical protein
MQITKTVFAALLAATAASAAPATTEVSMMAETPDWTIENMKRTCDQADTKCTWNFAVNTKSGNPTSCTMVVKANGDTKASRAAGGPVTCGPFTVTSGWSGQFVEGFTTLAVVDHSKRLIVWPAYRDGQLVNGKVVKPDQSYKPARLP